MTPEELLKSLEHGFYPPSAMGEINGIKVVCLQREIDRLHKVIRDEWPSDQAEQIINNCKQP
jgi:hypothetical protein